MPLLQPGGVSRVDLPITSQEVTTLVGSKSGIRVVCAWTCAMHQAADPQNPGANAVPLFPCCMSTDQVRYGSKHGWAGPYIVVQIHENSRYCNMKNCKNDVYGEFPWIYTNVHAISQGKMQDKCYIW